MIRSVLWIFLLGQFNQADARCTYVPKMVFCQYALPTVEDLKKGGPASTVIIQGYRGNLTLSSVVETDAYSAVSIQIQRSTIDWIQPSFFARLSNRQLTSLVLVSVTGTLQLDYATLAGLEDSLVTLRISDYEVRSMDYIHSMNKLKELYLVRTGLRQLPATFPVLLSRLNKLDLSSNRLKEMPWGRLVERANMSEFQNAQLRENNWTCDCGMRPILEATNTIKRKIIDLKCSYPGELAKLTVTNLKLKDLCLNENWKLPQPLSPSISSENTGVRPNVDGPSGGYEVDSMDSMEPGQSHVGPAQNPIRLNQNEDEFGQESDVQLATAGSVSTEVIAIIVAVVFVVLIVLIAVIVFKVRSRNQRRPQQAQQSKKPSHKSNAYCHVIEHPSSKQGGPTKNSGPNAAPPPPTGPGTQSNALVFGRDLDHNERQPLAPSYYSQQDNRL